mmetsp:Transcript_4018/g.7708  ORF Transcript_4018/g.7708 Transcript_4018/m.7708 type:complete len:273 (-) Transcript_4018:241-1059(-)
MPRAPGQRPRMLMCYICGREYGTKSLPIHIPQCQKKWLEVEATKPKSQRRPLPKPPQTYQARSDDRPLSISDVDAFNEAAFATFNNESMVACEHCGRTFKDDRLAIHQRSCRPGNEARPVQAARERKHSDGRTLDENVRISKAFREGLDIPSKPANRRRASSGSPNNGPEPRSRSSSHSAKTTPLPSTSTAPDEHARKLQPPTVSKRQICTPAVPSTPDPSHLSPAPLVAEFCAFCGHLGVVNFCQKCGKQRLLAKSPVGSDEEEELIGDIA